MVNMLSKRIANILKLLLESKKPLTSEEISKFLGVSSRTVRSDIKALNDLLRKNGGIINSEKSKGYTLLVSNKILFNKFEDENVEKDDKHLLEVKVSTPEERISYIITKLLLNALNDRQITQMDLAEEMFISLSTLKNDLKEVEKKLAKYDLKIIGYKTKGMMIHGNEAQIRYCISEYIFSSNKSNCIDDNEFYKNIFNGIDLGTLKEIVLKIISKYSIRLTDAAFENILTHIAITIKRSSNKNLIVYSIDQINVIEKTSEFSVVKEIVKEIYEKLNIYLIETEIYYITQHLIASKKYLNIIENEDIDECDYIVQLIVNRVKEITEIDFSDDGQLITGLKIHLKIAISRMKFDMNIRNDMLEVIKNNYPLAFQIAVIASKVIEEKEQVIVDENEIGYVAIHFGAALSRKGINNEVNYKTAVIVCSTGIGTAFLIKAKIEEYFKTKIKVIKTISGYELDEKLINSVDLILTTIPIRKINSEKIVQVGNLLDENDIKKIQDKLLGKDNSNELRYEDFFRKECFYKNKNLKSRNEVIEFLTNEMVSKGFMTGKGKESIFEREEMSSTEIGHLVAIPHPIENDTKISSISILVLEKPIIWDELPVQVVFLISISNDKFKLWETVFMKMFKYLVEENGVKELIKNKNYDKFINNFIK
ncbi:BglG family transcription antiterminator [Clostridium beijerinckii]|uniref:BglG family transcription antiterminator n=1 Tax=Clostridium beijerinckii TaxID=1520 RepID=UPI00156F9D06|nr:BglG family transcription antiterminator [Clostridium beijerinckii]NRT74174.1 lichenan operon transcriptional antiterminator [Clostridium beijerinckii]